MMVSDVWRWGVIGILESQPVEVTGKPRHLNGRRNNGRNMLQFLDILYVQLFIKQSIILLEIQSLWQW